MWLLFYNESFFLSRLILRIRCDSSVSQCPLGMKFGCDALTDAPHLLNVAHSLGLNVVGISFHVGSGCQDPPVYERAISAARSLFDLGSQLGFNMSILDIGGGFPGNKGTSIDKVGDVGFLNFFPFDEIICEHVSLTFCCLSVIE